MDVFRPILKQTSFQILGKIVTSFSTFIILGIVTRNFHETGTGVFTLALTYLSIFNLLADFGFNAHVLKEGLGKWQELLGTRLAWGIVLTILAVITLPFWPFSSLDFNQAILLGASGILGSSIFITCNLIFQQKLRYDLSVVSSSIGTLVSLLIYLYLSFHHFPIFSLLLGYSAGWILIGILSLILVRKFIPKIKPIFNLNYSKRLFLDSWAIAFTLALNVVYFRLDSFLIAYFKGTSDVGIYNVSYSVFQSALVFPSFIMNAYYPMMLKSLGKIKQVGFGLLSLAVLGTGTTLILAPVIIKVLTGGAFAGSVLSLQILALGFPAFFVSSLLMWLLVTHGKYKKMLGIYLAGLILNTILNLIFIPPYSFYAASWTTVISEYFILILQAVVLFFS